MKFMVSGLRVGPFDKYYLSNLNRTHSGSPLIGTLGIIIEAKKLGHVDNIQQKMDELRNIGFWISEQLYQHVLEIEKRL